jgi:hypothetical protein
MRFLLAFLSCQVTKQKFKDALFSRSIFFLGLLTLVAGMYVSLPKHGDIWWSDASRNALNGAFVLDFLRAAPFRHPVEFAYDYYRQWPALTILFSPPLFYVVLAGVYAALGVSEASALIVEFAFLFLLAWGAFRLSRRWLDPLPASAVVLLLIGAPQLAFWGQQIMLDVPAYAFIVWGADFFVGYLRTRAKAPLYLVVVCLVAAIYTKYNAVFFTVVFALTVLYARGWSVFRDGSVWRATALGIGLLLPVVILFFAFASYDLEQAASMPGSPARWSAESLSYYARILPTVFSWPTVVLACLYTITSLWMPALRPARMEAVFLVAWVVVGYVFYSMIAVKEPRHILFITYPFALAAVLLLVRLLPQVMFRSALILTLAGGVLVQTLVSATVPFVTGMRQAAELVARIAPPDTNVGFWGSRDGTFVYAMRAYTGRRDLGIVRIDKLLFRDLAVYFEHGFQEKGMEPAEITNVLAKLHVQYVVLETGFHDDVPAVQNLEAALASDKFTEVERVPMYANYRDAIVGELIVYRLKQNVPPGRVAPPMEIRLLGQSL